MRGLQLNGMNQRLQGYGFSGRGGFRWCGADKFLKKLSNPTDVDLTRVI